MGVQVPAGEHEVEFLCARGTKRFSTMIVVLLASAVSAAFLLMKKDAVHLTE
jgi:hypothetical protein